jgi:heme-degrading monooxygenase HmoA
VGFIAIYRWRVAAEAEAAFRERWRSITKAALQYGAFGSTLTRAENGEFVAIALWPDQQTRADAFARIEASPPLAGVEFLEELRLEVVEDLWTVSPFR